MALGPLGPGPNTLEKRWLRLVGVVPAGLPAQGIPGWHALRLSTPDAMTWPSFPLHRSTASFSSRLW